MDETQRSSRELEEPATGWVEVSAKTVDAAVDEALEELALSREQVDVEVLSQGRKAGLFGFRGESARVRVTALPSAVPASRPVPAEVIAKEPAVPEHEDIEPEVVEAARVVLEELLEALGIPSRVEVKTRREGRTQVTTVLDIVGEDQGLLIGRGGETLSTLQYVVNLIVGRKHRSRATVMVDVEGYRQRRYRRVEELAGRMAERARISGRTVELNPMPARERRVVHLALADHPSVVTKSVGTGMERKVAIIPRL